MSKWNTSWRKFRTAAGRELKRYELAISSVQGVLEAASKLRNPGQSKIMTMADIVLTGVHRVASSQEEEEHSQGWISLEVPYQSVPAVHAAIRQTCQYPTVDLRKEDPLIYLVEAPQVKILVVLANDRWRSGIYVQAEEGVEPARAVICELVWKAYGSRIEAAMGENFSLVLGAWKHSTGMRSGRADELHARVQLFLDAGVHRSIILHGPPGTGKSCAARHVATKVGGLVLAVSAADFAGLPEECVEFLAEVMRPDVLIVDDIDRFGDRRAAMLHRLEVVCRSVKLLLATANNIGWMDSATIRPGRFDEVVVFDHLEPGAVESVIGGVVPSEVLTRVAQWPIAFVTELRRRVDVLGVEAALAELPGLETRAIATMGKLKEEED